MSEARNKHLEVPEVVDLIAGLTTDPVTAREDARFIELATVGLGPAPDEVVMRTWFKTDRPMPGLTRTIGAACYLPEPHGLLVHYLTDAPPMAGLGVVLRAHTHDGTNGAVRRMVAGLGLSITAAGEVTSQLTGTLPFEGLFMQEVKKEWATWGLGITYRGDEEPNAFTIVGIGDTAGELKKRLAGLATSATELT